MRRRTLRPATAVTHRWPRGRWLPAVLACAVLSLGAPTAARAACGTVSSWGDKFSRAIPPAGLTDVRAVVPVGSGAIALKNDGTLVFFGTGSFGIPAGVAGKKDIAAVDAGLQHAVALTGSGTVVAWGNNTKGQTTVPAGLNSVVAVAAGWFHNVALKADGTIVAWGADKEGCVSQANGQKGFVRIDAKRYRTAGIKADGTVVIWGDAGAVKTVPKGLQARQIALGNDHAVAIRKDRTVIAWGGNSKGQTVVPAGLKDIVQVAAGSTISGAIKSDGTLIAWGDNSVGQTNVAKGAGYFALSMDGWVGYSVSCAAVCGAVSFMGCCGTGALAQCVDDGGGYKVSKTTCGAGKSCGWSKSAGAYTCGAGAAEAPGGLPPIYCGLACVPQCGGKTCGPDGCGGSCGSCKASEFCDAKGGTCKLKCAPGCTDGDACTVNDKCEGDSCVGTPTTACDDKNVCTTDSCVDDKGKASCKNLANGMKCDDGDACTADDGCEGGSCGAGTVTSSCATATEGKVLKLACAAGKISAITTANYGVPAAVCPNPKAGSCGKDVALLLRADCIGKTSCSTAVGHAKFGDPCPNLLKTANVTYACKVAQSKKLDCDDGNACTDDSCESKKGCIKTANTAQCDDGDACTLNEKCSATKCGGATTRDCNDGDLCTDDSCDAKKGCVNALNAKKCDDGISCTDDSCDGKKGCVNTANPAKCEDGNGCTDDSCDAKKGCVNAANTAKCQDNNPCTVDDKCNGGTCNGTTKVITSVCGAANVGPLKLACTAGKISAITFANYGVPAAACPAPKAGACGKDATALMKNTCLGKASCSTTAWQANFGDPCPGKQETMVVTYECTAEVSKHKALDCNDDNACTDDSCDPKKGCINTTNPNKCKDGTACTDDSCDPNEGCINAANAAKCDDGNACTDDTCDAAKGCAHTANIGKCEDGNVCTTADVCKGGTCSGDASKLLNCDDGSVCTDDSCEPYKGCVNKPKPSKCGPAGVCDGKTGLCHYQQCPDVPFVGCCVGAKVRTCYAGKPFDLKCATGRTCGWVESNKEHGCPLLAVAGADPSGVHPRFCANAPKCSPKCDGKNCGPDGCGGACGTCKSPQTCNQGVCGKDPCAAIPKAQCCQGDNVVICEKTADGVRRPRLIKCQNNGMGPCGWRAASQDYFCKGYGADPTGVAPKACPATVCIPKCNSNLCGSDGCGGACGPPCPAGKVCGLAPSGSYKKCVPQCLANCAGKVCGNDGCGGLCPNKCGEDKYCVASQGICKPFPNLCGDVPKSAGCCDGNDLKLCGKQGITTRDCKWYGGRCGWNGTSYDCMENGKADPSGKNPWICKGGAKCEPDCTGKTCGPDGCGGVCGKCKAPGSYCSMAQGKCEASCDGVPTDGCCTGTKLRRCTVPGAKWAFKFDCASAGKKCGWNAQSKAYVCGVSSDVEPTGTLPKACLPPCVPSCKDKACGGDGCGGVCGTCDAGQKCEAATGVCKKIPVPSECGTVNGHGGCDGDNVVYCANGQLIKRSCPNEGLKKCGWADGIHAYACGTSGYSSGAKHGYPKTIKGGKELCYPNCESKQCGADGCGGSCGTCAQGSTCNAGGVCKPDCGDLPTAGCCSGDILRRCDSASPKGVDCSTKVMAHNAFTGAPVYGTCAFDTAAKRYDCIAKTKSPPKTDASGKVPATCPACAQKCDPAKPCSLACGKQCGVCTAGSTCDWGKGKCVTYNAGSCSGQCDKKQLSWQCQCDQGCKLRKDCCEDYFSKCYNPWGGDPYCGDGTCDQEHGETCKSCNSDCGACLKSDSHKPPFEAVAGTVVDVFKGTKAARQDRRFADLDELLPSAPPLPREDLLAMMSAGPTPGSARGHPGVHVVSTKIPGAKGAGLSTSTSADHGLGVRFTEQNGEPNWGMVRLIAPEPLPRETKVADQHPGGMTLSMWVQLPNNRPNLTNPLASLVARQHGSVELCKWSRKHDSEVHFSCPHDKIVALQAYYGHVDSNAAATGSCYDIDKLRPSYTCHYDGIQALVEKDCLGKFGCSTNPWTAAKDPCGKWPYKPNKSTLVIRALCADPNASSFGGSPTLLVSDKASGQTLQWKVPGNDALVGKKSHAKGGWTHVAVTLQPFADDKTKGVTTLYVNGVADGSSMSLPMPSAHEVVVGAARTPSSSKTLNAKSGWLATLAHSVDDIALYGRALGANEIRALRAKDISGLAQVWPSTAPRQIVARGYRLSGQGAQVAKVQNKHLLQGTPSKVLPKPYLTARQRALSLSAGTSYQETSVRQPLQGLSTFTLAAWLRVPHKLAPDKPLIELVHNGEAHLTIAASSACDGMALTAGLYTAAGGPKTNTSCTHALRLGDWHFVSYTHKVGRKELRIDGVLIGVHPFGKKMPIFDDSKEAKTGIRVSGGVDLYWAALYRRVLSLDGLESLRSRGPAVWLGNFLYQETPKGSWHIQDYANLHRNTGAKGPVGQVWPQLGFAPPQSHATIPGGLHLDPVNTSHGWAVKRWYFPAEGRFRFGESTDKHPAFSWMGKIVLEKKDLQAQIPLVSLLGKYIKQNPSRSMFAAKLVCRRHVDAKKATGKKLGAEFEFLVPITCRVETSRYERTTGKVVYSASKDVVGHYSAMAPKATGEDLKHRPEHLSVAFAFDGVRVTAASVGSPTVQVYEIVPGKGVVSQSLGMQPEVVDLVKTKTAPWFDKGVVPAASAAPGPGGFFAMIGADSNTTSFKDVRMYARALDRFELHQATTSGCAFEPCAASGRTCLESKEVNMRQMAAVCGSCEQPSVASSSLSTGKCMEKKRFMQACTVDRQCTSGKCDKGRCVSPQKSAECVDHCAKLGRTCTRETIYGTSPYWVCSVSCVPSFVPPSPNSPTKPCIWAPDRDSGALCDADGQCKSGRCISTPEFAYHAAIEWNPTCNQGRCKGWKSSTGGQLKCNAGNSKYKGKWISGDAKVTAACPSVVYPKVKSTATKRCTATTKAECVDQNREAIAVGGTGLGDGVSFTCSKWCRTDTYAGIRLFRQAFAFMSPRTCVKIYASYQSRFATGLDTGLGQIYNDPTANRLVKLVLAKNKGLTSAKQITDLQLAGVGPTMLEYAFGDADTRARLNKPFGALRLADCVNGTTTVYGFENVTSPYFDRKFNRPVCVPNKFPNGVPCPPPGVDKTKFSFAPGTPFAETPHAFCESGFCGRDTGKCEDGDGRMENNNNLNRSDKKSAKKSNFGPLSSIQLNQNVTQFSLRPTFGQAETKSSVGAYRPDRRVTHSGNASTISFFGESLGALRMEFQVATSAASSVGGTATFDTTARVFFFGLSLPVQKPAASCVGFKLDSKGKKTTTKCDKPALDNLKYPKMPAFDFCVPNPFGCKPKGTPQKPKTCVSKTILLTPVPLAIEASVKLAVCAGIGMFADHATRSIGWQFKPQIGLALDVRGGVGAVIGQGLAKVWAGIRAVLVIANVALPFRSGVSAAMSQASKSQVTPNMWKVTDYDQLNLEVTVLKLSLSVFVQALVAKVFRVTWDYSLFELAGIKIVQNLFRIERSTKIDLIHPLANQVLKGNPGSGN